MELILETQHQENGTPVITADGVTMAFTPAIDEDYWRYRVRLSDKQAVVGFPKFSTIGIGFAKERDWNTNLPYHCPVEDIFKHIKHNKGSRKISDIDVRRAIQMIQDAAMKDRNDERRAMAKLEIPIGDPVAVRALDDALRAMGRGVLEHDTLFADRAALRTERAGLIASLDASKIEVDSLLHDLGVARARRDAVIAELEQAQIDRDERLTLEESSELAKIVDAERAENARLQAEVERLRSLAADRDWAADDDEVEAILEPINPADVAAIAAIGSIPASAGTELVPWEGEAAEPAPVAPPPLSDGGHVFMTLLLRLGVPTKDGRTLASMGAYALRELRHGVPLMKLVDPTSPHKVSDVVGRIMAVVRDADDVYAIGLAEPELAVGLNTGALCLGADLEADPKLADAERPGRGMEFTGARIIGAHVREADKFAWQM